MSRSTEARSAPPSGKALLRRILALPWRDKARLALRLYRDPRVAWRARLVLGGTMIYLAMPLDVIPDFIPILGQLDDLLVVAVALWLFRRLASDDVINEQIDRLVAERGAMAAPTG